MIKEYLEIGKITSTHGIKGEMRFQPWCDGPEFLTQFKTLYFDKTNLFRYNTSMEKKGRSDL